MQREELDAADLAYFRRGISDNPRFWKRFGGLPDIAGARVLDVGCGHGSLCIYLAQNGASRVAGVDLNEGLINFAAANLTANFPEVAQQVEFFCLDLHDYPPETFDLAVSKDSFEHVLDLPGLLSEIEKRLRPGGRLYAGFGPLYSSPYGDHDAVRQRVRLPWAHLFMGDQGVIDHVNCRRRQPISRISELGLNQLSLADYRRIFAESGLIVRWFRTNRSERWSGRLLAGLSRLPGLAEYFTFNIYCILEKPVK
ncbi:MAG: class I SAM-dependent methyltransferase [Caldilineales bacterium]|nr:class I SAM-dependent methyltransferase [Caldilineales bacterium]